MTRLIAALMMTLTPLSLAAEPLPEVISTYVTNFNAVTLGVEVRDKIRGIHDRSDLSHGMKVLLVHEELQNAGALEHADTHDFAPQPFQLSRAD